MADITQSNWSETDASNNQAAPMVRLRACRRRA
jgi:hypothetical protein